MDKKTEKRVSEIEKRIIQAEIEKISEPYKFEENNTAIKNHYKEISDTLKSGEANEKNRNLLLAASFVIISIFVMSVYLASLNPANDVTGAAVTLAENNFTEKTKIAEKQKKAADNTIEIDGRGFRIVGIKDNLLLLTPK
ncbi:MAG: hypothetical protein Q8O89_05385 [Nanoarchaeota archaeon]|nr:hypothetical protein [Nanoarchaeota archaeon]